MRCTKCQRCTNLKNIYILVCVRNTCIEYQLKMFKLKSFNQFFRYPFCNLEFPATNAHIATGFSIIFFHIEKYTHGVCMSNNSLLSILIQNIYFTLAIRFYQLKVVFRCQFFLCDFLLLLCHINHFVVSLSHFFSFAIILIKKCALFQ